MGGWLLRGDDADLSRRPQVCSREGSGQWVAELSGITVIGDFQALSLWHFISHSPPTSQGWVICIAS